MRQRLERVNQLIRDEVADILRRDIHDPLIGFVTITEVEVSPDLRFAKVFFSVLGDDEQVKQSTKGLLRARKYINARVAERIDLRYIPKLRFVRDDTAARAQQLEMLLQAEHEEFGDAPEPTEGAEAPPSDEHFDETGLDRDAEEDFDDDFIQEVGESEDFGDPVEDDALQSCEDPGAPDVR
ncbi:MAG: 30S ribosome-binding factor RbfA [Armatimonadetes bacterium]|nr:30S ribosome-binding factor RbfA [Armatimonadota bacterium]